MKLVGYGAVQTLIDSETASGASGARKLAKAAANWRTYVEAATWRNPVDVKRTFGSADQFGGNRIVFDICGNSYRFVVRMNYVAQIAEIRFAGDHAAYDGIDAGSV